MTVAAASAPRIETDRLVLRGHCVSDYESTIALWSDPEMLIHMSGRPFTPEECWQRLIRYIGMWPAIGCGYWALEDRETGAFLGDVGVADFKRAIDPPFGEAREAGWVLSPSVHGKGYATEAMRAALAWYDAIFSGARTVCMITPENAASIRVAGKLGYKEYARTTYHGDAVTLFERRPL